MDLQVSYIRLLVGDNSRTSPTYTDEQIQSAATISPTRPALPIDLQIAGLVGFVRYPIPA